MDMKNPLFPAVEPVVTDEIHVCISNEEIMEE
jgi:hypothetical protein